MSCENISVVDSVLKSLDAILGVRDDIGAKIHDIYFLTRTWTGLRPGDGIAHDDVQQLLPTPAIVDYSHSLKLTEGGNIRQGDIFLKGISKASYPNESAIDGSSPANNVEHFYLIDDRLYNVISVKEKYVTWDVQLRKLSSQTRYL